MPHVVIADADLRRLSDLAHELGELTNPEQRMLATIERVRDLLHGEIGGYNDIDGAAGKARVILNPLVVVNPGKPIEATMAGHPMIRHYMEHFDPDPRRITDLKLDRPWKDTEVYAEVFRPLGTPQMLAIPVALDLSRARGIAYAVTRSGRDFSEAERDLAFALQATLVALHHADPPMRPVSGNVRLTPREREVLRLLARGMSDQQIVRYLGVTKSTVRSHISRLYDALEVHDRVSAARKLGLLTAS